MQKNVLYVLSVITILLCSCVSLDEIDPVNSVPAENAINDFQSAQAAVNGIYDRLQNDLMVQDGYLIFAQLYTDEAIFSGANIFEAEFAKLNVQASNTANLVVFSGFYQIINAANNVIDLLPRVEDLTLNQSQLNSFLGEAYFLRALSYFFLINYYGDVPLVLKPTREVGEIINVFNEPRAATYAQIISDLKFAEQHIVNESIHRASAKAASALLARVYLYLEQWQNALEQAEKVLGPDFDLGSFAYLEDELFSLGFTSSDGNVLPFRYGPPELGGSSSVQPSGSILAAYEAGDIRKKRTVDDSLEKASVAYISKYNDFSGGASRSATDPIYFIRYAEVLLITAEAAAELGDFDQAGYYYNQVRKRAGLPEKTLNPKNFVDLILQERFVELAFEGPHRWLDLKRRGKATEVLAFKGYQACHDVWPFPQSEIDVNPNLNQNDCCSC